MSVHHAAAWAMGGQYVSFAIHFASTVIISRFFLGPAEVGLFSIALAAALLLAVVQDFGLSRYIAGLPALDPDEIKRCSSISLLFALAVAGLIAAAAWPMAMFYGQPQLAPIILIIAASYLFLPLSVVPMALLARGFRFRGLFAVNVGAAAMQATVGIALAAAGYSAFALAWAALAGSATRGIVAQLMRPTPLALRFDALRQIVRFGSGMSLLNMTGALGSRTPDLIVGRILGLTAVGLYSRAASISDQFRMLISGAIGSVFYPAFARIRDRGEPLGPSYLRVCAGYSAVVWPGMAGLALAAEPLVRFLYGEAWIRTAPMLSMIAIAEIMLVALPLVSELPILLGRMRRLLALSVADTLLSVTLLAIGSQWGVEGAAASRIVYALAWLGLYGRFMHRLVEFDGRALLSIYARSAAATLAAIAPLGCAYLLWSPAEIGMAGVLAAAILGGVAWLACLAALRHPALDDLLTVVAIGPIARVIGGRSWSTR